MMILSLVKLTMKTNHQSYHQYSDEFRLQTWADMG